jgi:hypothetical protein
VGRNRVSPFEAEVFACGGRSPYQLFHVLPYCWVVASYGVSLSVVSLLVLVVINQLRWYGMYVWISWCYCSRSTFSSVNMTLLSLGVERSTDAERFGTKFYVKYLEVVFRHVQNRIPL